MLRFVVHSRRRLRVVCTLMLLLGHLTVPMGLLLLMPMTCAMAGRVLDDDVHVELSARLVSHAFLMITGRFTNRMLVHGVMGCMPRQLLMRRLTAVSMRTRCGRRPHFDWMRRWLNFWREGRPVVVELLGEALRMVPIPVLLLLVACMLCLLGGSVLFFMGFRGRARCRNRF